MPELPSHIAFIERGVLHSNSVILHADDGFAVVDTGYHTGAEALERALAETVRRPLAELALIANTHAHPDHTGGNAYLHARTGCAIAMSDIDRTLVDSGDPVTLMRDWADLACPAFPVTRTLAPGDTLAFGPSELLVIDAAGHAAGEISYYSAADRLLICGDLLWATGFSNVVPLVEGIGGLARHERSLTRLKALDVEIAIPGHGPLIAGRAAVQRRIDETIETIRFYRQNPQRWALTALKAFVIMHVLAAGSIVREPFIARCSRAPWFREQAARHFAGAAGLLDEFVDELLAKRILVRTGDTITCTLRA